MNICSLKIAKFIADLNKSEECYVGYCGTNHDEIEKSITDFEGTFNNHL